MAGSRDPFSVESAGYDSFSSTKGIVRVEIEGVGKDRGDGDEDSLLSWSHERLRNSHCTLTKIWIEGPRPSE